MRLVMRSGEIANLLDLTPNIRDICWNLAGINRYCAAGERSFSVAQHSLLVAHLCPSHLKLQALLHDAHEAYVQDLPRPVKEAFRHVCGDQWDRFESFVADQVRRYYKIPVTMHHMVKGADNLACLYEVGSVFSPKAVKAFAALGYNAEYSKELSHLLAPMTREGAYIELLTQFKLTGVC